MNNSEKPLFQKLQTWSKGFEKCDLAQVLEGYDDQAEIEIFDCRHPPSTPMRIQGREAISVYYGDVLKRSAPHTIEFLLITEAGTAFRETSTDERGQQFVSQDFCQMKNGKIIKQSKVQAWDEGAL